MRSHRVITAFVICWTLLFHYETLRANYLGPLLDRPLPKVPLLFPPAGWIMFFRIDRSYGFAEVYGLKDNTPVPLDPHAIFETRFVGYDNIRRNVLIGVLDRQAQPRFCRYLRRKFPDYQAFAVLYGEYPDIVDAPDRALYRTAYRCRPD
jgi:hypothetical protein